MVIGDDFRTEMIDYLKIEDDDVDVDAILEAAIQKAEIESGKVFDETKPLYKQAIKMLTLDWYDHRGSITTENIKELPLAIGVQAILNQIALSSEFTKKEITEVSKHEGESA